MNIFKEVADIKTADQLNLPVPKVEYHTVVCKPTEHQKALVKELSKRAEKVHAGSADASKDNMLKITSDGRKLGLDQRIINPALPDEPGTKVNQCVANILRHWRDGEAEKLTQLGSKHAYFKLKEVFPQICLVHLYALEGAIHHTAYNCLSKDTKRELKQFSDQLKNK